jgi:hypothetical protein
MSSGSIQETLGTKLNTFMHDTLALVVVVVVVVMVQVFAPTGPG